MRFLALEIGDLVDDVVDELGCREDVAYIETILRNGTSADRQTQVFNRALADGATEQEALIAVVDHLVQETTEGI